LPNGFTSRTRPVEFLTLSQARDVLRAIATPIQSLFPPAISDITLSGAVMQAPGAYLELNVPSYVDGNSGEITFLQTNGPHTGGEVYLRLLGLAEGATYLGQMRCAADLSGSEEGAIAVNVFGGAQGTQFGQVRVTQRSLSVPFVFVSSRGPVPFHEADNAPMVAFNPVRLRNWFVHDIRIQRVI